MRLLAIACCLALGGAAGCGGDEEERPAAPDRDDPVSAPADPAPDAGDPTPPRVCRRLGRRLVGAALADARERAQRRGCTLRVAVLDGEPQALTEDFQPARINVRVRDGAVTGIEFIG
jgi:hypothetical protein